MNQIVQNLLKYNNGKIIVADQRLEDVGLGDVENDGADPEDSVDSYINYFLLNHGGIDEWKCFILFDAEEDSVYWLLNINKNSKFYGHIVRFDHQIDKEIYYLSETPDINMRNLEKKLEDEVNELYIETN